MRHKNRKSAKKQKVYSKKKGRITRVKKKSRKHGRARRKRLGGVRRRRAITDPRVVRALGAMRREGISASEAARHERMKLKTFRERAGRYPFGFDKTNFQFITPPETDRRKWGKLKGINLLDGRSYGRGGLAVLPGGDHISSTRIARGNTARTRAPFAGSTSIEALGRLT